jgi:hypothetical protein
MKKIISKLMTCALLTFPFFYSTSSHAFVELFCTGSASPADYEDDNSFNRTAVIKELVNLTCVTPKIDMHQTTGLGVSHTYKVTIEGVGLGLRAAWYEMNTIICPTVRSSALGVDFFYNKRGKKKAGVQHFYGIKASAEALIGGGDAAVFANGTGGVCVLAGVQIMGLGAGISVPKITFERK